MKKILKKLQYSLDTKLKFVPLVSLSSWKICVFADASFGNASRNGTQGAFIIVLIDGKRNSCPIAWQSKRLTRVVHSTLAAETLAMVLATDAAIFIQEKINEILSVKPNIHCFTDSKSLVQAINSTKPVLEKRLRIDIAALAENLEKGEIESISWIDTHRQLANSLTKGVSGDRLLTKVLSMGFMSVSLPNAKCVC